MGAIGCGKTTLCQALRGEAIVYDKTQAVEFHPEMIDTPGEFILHRQYYAALTVTAKRSRCHWFGAKCVRPRTDFFTRIWPHLSKRSHRDHDQS